MPLNIEEKRGKKRESMNNKKGSKRAQITIFVIIAIVLVAGILGLIFYKDIKKFIAPTINDFLPADCLQESVKDILTQTAMRGGLIEPELYFRYNNETINYLCYTSEWYKTCTMQTPLLKQSIENEVNANAKAKMRNCIEGMKKNLESRGYSVKTTGTGDSNIVIIPKKIVITSDLTMTLQKGDETQTIPSSRLTTDFDSNAYELVMIASSIQNYEARYGDSSIDTYMGFYPNIKVEKYKQDDGTKVYIITDRTSGEKLQFATRSLAWPPGYYATP